MKRYRVTVIHNIAVSMKSVVQNWRGIKDQNRTNKKQWNYVVLLDSFREFFLSVVIWESIFWSQFISHSWLYISSWIKPTMFDFKYSADFKKSFAEQSSIIGRMATTIFVRWGSGGPFNPSVISAKLHCCLESVSWDSSERGAFVIHFSTRIFQNNWLLVESCHHEPSFKICYFSEFCGHGGILWENIILACAALKMWFLQLLARKGSFWNII